MLRVAFFDVEECIYESAFSSELLEDDLLRLLGLIVELFLTMKDELKCQIMK